MTAPEPTGERDLVNALNNTLWKVLSATPEIKDGVEISFEIPQRDWPPLATGEKPKLNLFLYDVRENPDMRREFTGQRPNAPFGGPGLPAGQRIGVNLSYMVTCWGGTPAEQHRILWAALEQLYAFSPLRNGTGENQNFVHQYLAEHDADPHRGGASGRRNAQHLRILERARQPNPSLHQSRRHARPGAASWGRGRPAERDSR